MSEPPISRGFRGRGRGGTGARVPPGQHLVTDFPVLSAGPTPESHLQSRRFTQEDGASPLGEWTWEQFNALPQIELTVDIHCVTTWSKLDTHWRGVSIDTLLEAAGLSEPPEKKRSRRRRRLPLHWPDGSGYWSWSETVLNSELSEVPSALTAAMIAIEIPAAIRPYSIAVAPSSFLKNATSVDI